MADTQTALSGISSAIVTIACAFVTFVVGMATMLLYRRLRSMAEGNKIPGPRASIWSGNDEDIHKAGGLSGMSAYLEELHHKYGPVVRLWLSPKRLLVSVSDSDLAKLVLVSARDRPPPTLQVALPATNSMVFSSEREAHMRRSFLDYHLHTSLMFKAHDIAAEVAALSMKQLSEAAVDGKMVDVKALGRSMATGVIGAAIYGNWFLKSPLYQELTALIPKVAAGKQVWAYARFSRLSPPAWFSASLRSYLSDYQRLTGIGEELIQASMRNAEAQVASGVQVAEMTKSQISRRAALQMQTEEFISALLSEKTMLGEHLYDRAAATAGMVALMFHGCLSMAALCTAALVSIAQNPGVQEQVHNEIEALCGPTPPSEDDLMRMQYLLAVIHEAARFGPLSPTLTRCSLERDVKLGDYVVPAGATLVVPTRGFLLDEKIWGKDSAEFNPERFLKRQKILPNGKRMHTWAQSLLAAHSNAKGWTGATLALGAENDQLPSDSTAVRPSAKRFDPRMGIEESGHVNRNADCYAFVDPGAGPHFLAFGAGPRTCVGRRFGMHMVRALVAGVLQECDVEMAGGAGVGGVGGGDGGEKLEVKLESLMLTYSPDPWMKVSLREKGAGRPASTQAGECCGR